MKRKRRKKKTLYITKCARPVVLVKVGMYLYVNQVWDYN